MPVTHIGTHRCARCGANLEFKFEPNKKYLCDDCKRRMFG